MISMIFLGLLLLVLICMAAPSATPRVVPTGIMLEEGAQALITFALDTNIELWEIEVQPPGWDNGDSINVTTQHNLVVQTKAPRKLKEVTNSTLMVAYDPICEVSCKAAIGRRDTVTYTWPDGSTDAQFGYMKSFIPQALKHGEFPTANVEIVYTNLDSSFDEQVPVHVDVAGT